MKRYDAIAFAIVKYSVNQSTNVLIEAFGNYLAKRHSGFSERSRNLAREAIRLLSDLRESVATDEREHLDRTKPEDPHD